MREESKPFAVNRTLTLGVLLTLAVQTASGLIWAGSIDARLHAAELELMARAPKVERVAVIEAQISMIRQSLDRIERKVTHMSQQSEQNQ